MGDKIGLLPPPDLLQRLDGIEAGLRRNRKIGLAGWFGLLPSLVGLVATTNQGRAQQAATDRGLLSGFLVIGAVSIFLIGRSRLWRKESREPFRYTCSVTPFEPLGLLAEEEFSELSEWMVYDLSERLNERIGRLSFLETVAVKNGEEQLRPNDDRRGSHIDVTGQYLVRGKPDQRVIELTPRVRIGDSRSAATLGHAVKFTITRSTDDAARALDTAGAANGSRRPPVQMQQDEYDKLIERVYFSVATQIYRQIRSDVQNKIALLPTRFLRATAYFFEAEDYAHSNTLDAYDEARELYDAAMQLYDPRLRPPPSRRIYRPGLWLSQLKTGLAWPVRRVLANFWPRLGMPEVMTARAEIGYANTLLYRRLLAGMQGHRVNSTFEARPVVQRAIARLLHLPKDVVGRQEALFQAHVTAALSWWALDSTRQARSSLREARRIFPSRFDSDARYLYAAGLTEPRLHSAVPVLRHAVEQDPRFEIAQFQLAIRNEMAWRRGATLERTVAKIVSEEYDAVLKLNPGNIRAWGNIGYMRWLLGDLVDARMAYERGREYKLIQRGTDVASLDSGLARVAAEQGDLEEAYTCYLSAFAAQRTQGVSDARVTSAQYYIFDYIGDAMLSRFDRYRKEVVGTCDRMKRSLPEAAEPNSAITPLVYDAVAAFALNDYAEACHTYYIRNADEEAKATARRCYKEAIQRNRRFASPYYNLYLMSRYESNLNEALTYLNHVQELEPGWPDAMLAKLALRAEWVSDRTWRKPVKPVTNQERRSRRKQPMFELDKDTRQEAKLDECGPEVKEQLESLLPHAWLWKSDRQGQLEFNWRAVAKGSFEKAMRWEKGMDDLHVRSLFMWNIAHLFTRGRGGSSDPEMLLQQIKDHFWPSDLRVLLTWRQMRRDPAADAAVQELVRHWLGQDATSYWALELLTTDVHDFQGNKIVFFTRDEKEMYLRKALEELDVSSTTGEAAQSRAGTSMRRWIESQMDQLVEQPVQVG